MKPVFQSRAFSAVGAMAKGDKIINLMEQTI